jgi:ABC-type multidrug transport system ATPase subunit
MAGVLSPQKGHVEINGLRRRSSVEAELEIRKKVVYLPDQPWLPNQRTGREFLLAVGNLYEVETDRLFDHIDRLMQLFDLSGQADSLIGSYSTGQKKKIAVCAALVTEAPILLLDEPFSGGLDPSALLALKRVLQRLAQRDDITIVLASPVPELLEEIADRIAVVRDGTILACDTIPGLRQRTGCDGSLEDVLQRLINPQTIQNLERYFENR